MIGLSNKMVNTEPNAYDESNVEKHKNVNDVMDKSIKLCRLPSATYNTSACVK